VRNGRQRLLLVWLYAVAAIQTICYVVRMTRLDVQGLSFYLDPRFTFTFVEAAFRGETSLPISSIAASVIVAIFASRISKGGTAAFAYVLFEGMYTLLTIILFFAVIVLNMSPAHGFSPRELLIPGVVYVFASFVPAILAIGIYNLPSRNREP
jgi:hypothetical protein